MTREPVDLNGTDAELAEALWHLQHEKSELYEQEARVTRELARRSEKGRIKVGEFEVLVEHRARVKRDVPTKFLGSEAEAK